MRETRGPISDTIRAASANKQRCSQVQKATDKLWVLEKIERFKEDQIRAAVEKLKREDEMKEEDREREREKVCLRRYKQ